MPESETGSLAIALTSAPATDIVLSADGTKLFTAGADGDVRVYEVATRTLVATWRNVGTRLGGMDLSPDGSFLMVTETGLTGFREQDGWYYSTSVVYQVDTATGVRTTHSIETMGGDTTFYDVAVLADDTVLLTQGAYSAHLPLWTLDLDSGEFTASLETHSNRSTLQASADRSHALFADGDISSAPMHLYEAGVGITHTVNTAGYNAGTMAISEAAGLIAQNTMFGTFVYALTLNSQVEITNAVPGHWLGANICGLVFDPSGTHLFLLDADTSSIHQLLTADWSLVNTFPVGADVGDRQIGYFGNRLELSPDGTFSVMTTSGVRLVQNPDADNTFAGTSDADNLAGGAGTDTLMGGAGDDTIDGGSGSDDLRGGENNDVLTGGTGDDSLHGGEGNDIVAGGPGGDNLIGYAGFDILDYRASAGGVIIDLRTSTASGGDATGDRIWSFAGVWGSELSDTIYASQGYNQLFGFSGNDDLRAGSDDDILDGGLGDDTLNGGGGNDTMIGGKGNDSYHVDAAGDVVREAAGGGNDTVYTGVSYRLTAGVHVERLSTKLHTATTAMDLTGNSYTQTIYGNAGANVLDGKGGGDLLIGLGGDDTYHINTADDVIQEAEGGGNDTLIAPVSYTLGAGLEIEVLRTLGSASTYAVHLTGNAFAQTILGNAAANVLDGTGGADILRGYAGDDTYYVDNAADSVIEAAGGGNDTVITDTSYQLAAGRHVELLRTWGSGTTEAINLTGNEFAQTILGNAAANVLDGKGGADVLRGYVGDDTYYVDNAADSVIEAANGGNDTVITNTSYQLAAGQHVELLRTWGSASRTAIDLTGNEFANALQGNAEANVLDGKGGTDSLRGHGGNDTFGFTTALGTANVDTIVDFIATDDTIALDEAVFAGLGFGPLAAGAFVTGSAAADADDRIIYDNATGALLFDADGVGGAAAVQFAMLSGAPTIAAGDFLVI